MALNTSTLETNLNTKMNATTGTTEGKEFLLLGKAVEALTPTVTVAAVVSEGTTQVGLVTTAGTTQVAAVQAAASGYAPLANPTFTGVPAAPTAGAGTNTTQLATTAFVNGEVAALVDSAPGTLDTLNELAAALNDDANFSTTVTNSIATKMPLAGGTFTGDVTFGDSNKAIFGAGSDLQIYHDGSHSWISDAAGVGNLYIRSNDLIVMNAPNNETLLRASQDGAVTAYHNGSAKLATTATGVDVTGDLSIGDHTRILADDDLKFIAPASTVGVQDARIAWWNETEAGIMAMIAVDRTASSYAPADLVFYTTDNVDTTANNSEGDRAERLRIGSSGDVNIVNELKAGSYNETYAALSGTSPAVNCETGNAFSLVLSGATTFTFTNPPASGTAYSFSVEIIQDSGASGHTVTWPTSVDWPAATAPTLTATASAKDIFVFTTRDGGTNWYGFTAGQALG